MTAFLDSMDPRTAPPHIVLDLDLLRATPVATDPFPYLIVPGFLKEEARAAVGADFPAIDIPGNVPLAELSFGPAFQRLIDAFCGPEFAELIESKFEIDLTGLQIMITARGMSQADDGRIHTDRVTTIVTVLLYMNDAWETPGGQLRILHGPDDFDRMAAELPPRPGTLLVFLNGPTAWHGHKPFVGRRRSIQLNWVNGDDVPAR